MVPTFSDWRTTSIRLQRFFSNICDLFCHCQGGLVMKNKMNVTSVEVAESQQHSVSTAEKYYSQLNKRPIVSATQGAFRHQVLADHSGDLSSVLRRRKAPATATSATPPGKVPSATTSVTTTATTSRTSEANISKTSTATTSMVLRTGATCPLSGLIITHEMMAQLDQSVQPPTKTGIRGWSQAEQLLAKL